MIHHRHGVSIRHLPGYLDWISYKKSVKYSIERDDQAELPIDLKYAYGEYHYGIFAPKKETL